MSYASLVYGGWTHLTVTTQNHRRTTACDSVYLMRHESFFFIWYLQN